MADHTKSVTNSVNLFGGSPASLWNQYNWNAFKWGEGTTTMIWHLEHRLSSETITLTDALAALSVGKLISNEQALSSDMTALYHQDRAGYYYNYPDRVTNVDSAVTASYTQVAVTSQSWTTYTTGTTVWS